MEIRNCLGLQVIYGAMVMQVPPPGKGSLYIRPLLMGSGPILGLAPAPEFTFLIYSSPVRNYFKVSLSLKEAILGQNLDPRH